MDYIDMQRWIFASGVTFFLLALLAFGLKKYQQNAVSLRAGGKQKKMLQVLETITLDSRHRVYRVQNGSREYVLVASAAGIKKLDSYPAHEALATPLCCPDNTTGSPEPDTTQQNNKH